MFCSQFQVRSAAKARRTTRPIVTFNLYKTIGLNQKHLWVLKEAKVITNAAFPDFKTICFNKYNSIFVL